MEFDKTRYVAPGVPRIEQKFVVGKLVNLLAGQTPRNEIDFGKPLYLDNPELDNIQGLRNGRIERSYDSQRPVGKELEVMAIREYVLGGSMLHGVLSLPEEDTEVRVTPSGILLVTPQRVRDFKAYLRSLSLLGNSDYLTNEIRDVDPDYLKAIELFANLAVPHYSTTKTGKDLVLLCSAMGSQVGYDLLVGQENEYRFRDAVGGPL